MRHAATANPVVRVVAEAVGLGDAVAARRPRPAEPVNPLHQAGQRAAAPVA